MNLKIEDIISYKKILETDNQFRCEFVNQIKDKYMFFKDKIYDVFYFCNPDIEKKMRDLKQINADFTIKSEEFEIFSMSNCYGEIGKIGFLRTEILKDKDVYIKYSHALNNEFHIKNNEIYLQIELPDTPYPEEIFFKNFILMRENTTDEEYQVCLELLKLIHNDWNFLLDCISEKSLMPFYLEDSIENLSKYKTKQDVLEYILGKAFPYDLNSLKFDIGYELIQAVILFLKEKDISKVYDFSKSIYNNYDIKEPRVFQFKGMFLLIEFLKNNIKIIDEELPEDYLSMLYCLNKKMDFNIKTEKEMYDVTRKYEKIWSENNDKKNKL